MTIMRIIVVMAAFVLGLVCVGLTGCGGESGKGVDKPGAKKLVDRGEQYQSEGDAERALKCYTLAIRKNPNSKRAHLCRAMLHESQGRTEEAIADFKRVAILDKEDYYSVQQIANLYRRAGDTAKADEYDAKASKRQMNAMSQTRENIERQKAERKRR